MNSESSPGFFLVTIQELEEDCLGPLENISKGKLCDEVLERTDRGTMPNPIRSLGGHRHLCTSSQCQLMISKKKLYDMVGAQCT